MASIAPLTLEFHSLGLDRREALIADVRSGLTKRPKELPPRWFYDERGSQLFEQITELPEYYQTRTETEILKACSASMVDRVQPEVILELGAGSSKKTRLLIEPAVGNGTLSRFVPFDISDSIVRSAASDLLRDFRELTIHAVIGDFSHHLDRVPRFGRQLVVFLGSTIGNFPPADRRDFLAAIRRLLAPDDAFLVGVDLVKDESELLAAYDDGQGVTAEFNLNVLRVINRELDADFNLAAFQHVARYDSVQQRIEMHLRSVRDQVVQIPAARLSVSFAAGELMMTEISAKFTRPGVQAELSEAALNLSAWYTDSRQRFALVLATPI